WQAQNSVFFIPCGKRLYNVVRKKKSIGNLLVRYPKAIFADPKTFWLTAVPDTQHARGQTDYSYDQSKRIFRILQKLVSIV
ncbi:Uncharacterized protein APZ42_006207, partial [Daphnia magna]